jgi:predicted ribonuclease YlaK
MQEGMAMAHAIAEVTITQAAFRSSRTRAVICTGRFHDIMLLPGGLDADLDEWQAGFIDTTGQFMDRREAATARRPCRTARVAQLLRRTPGTYARGRSRRELPARGVSAAPVPRASLYRFRPPPRPR